MTTAYYLTAKGTLKVGDEVHEKALGKDEFLSVDPRALPFTFTTDVDGKDVPASWLSMEELADGQLVLARLEPIGPQAVQFLPIPEERPDHPFVTSPDGWTVTGLESIAAMVGPQYQDLRAMACRLADELTAPGNRVASYLDIARNVFAEPTLQAKQAALTALGASGADEFSWACAFWSEGKRWEGLGDLADGLLLAVAARHLIGSVPGWDHKAYTMLTDPWTALFDALPHPDDAH